jgi:hypothetical protein
MTAITNAAKTIPVEHAICRHDGLPIARRTDRGRHAKWFHDDGGRGCADGVHEAEPDIIDAIGYES